ncbi:MAG: hypothetical protein A2W61_08265 [Deltaproteobacteria bacterium RIFCSPLOWO2_01_44_7]|nr:MAG: hypothetical protein A2712_02225 [Deltaproteobacteria bacterium RIFCSPHIGHO2_01_FULL_43_49]OGQ15058.1 MAG: hypothetical protein A3D22_03255 [Deltaproteobacteria bacterium RIFCSPHIGHO2_02_FULL_44_53]OGQ27322.1 MAG: hypothetical protein A3D98_02820 [Deltaproteobacteria bacterium RIFCSPHIGHO2_12_FULL_44_21]OGQ31575.1 MAG: hypothetical protein A2979_04415 [Deltaproteobacteria bacterium RIFCSPLOWO2_01_FULL_45_74]OGQ42613.1 MAG: hypothetical protein A2W61_08265 [Deltaproteobacteria bacterium 
MVCESKIKDLKDLAEELQLLKTGGKKIIQCHGVFDLLHIGHIKHFEEAKSFGDILVVTITADAHVNKGPLRPAFTQILRAKAIAALNVVDYVAINDSPTAVNAIKMIRPDVYAKGPDYKDASKDITGGILIEEEAVRSAGGEIKFTEDITFSASNILNNHLPVYPPEVNNYLVEFRQKYSKQTVFNCLESLKSLNVMVIGEAILDEYIYCDAMGKSAKEAILAMRYLRQDIHAGGSLAVANHLADFCNKVELVTYLGTQNTQEEFVRKNLKKNVLTNFIYKTNAPTIIKRRFVENYLLSKLLEIYEMNDEPLNDGEEEALCKLLESKVKDCDVVIVADYGHGLMTPKIGKLLQDKAPFLAVNAQINAANIGFHTISKYQRADYICIHENELRLDHRNRTGDLKILITNLANRLSSQSIMVTLGKRGTIFYRHGDGFFECPAFANKVIDRLGSGDALLALTSLCAAKEMPPDIMGLVGNLVGAQAVMILGNQTSINRVQLLKSIESILK